MAIVMGVVLSNAAKFLAAVVALKSRDSIAIRAVRNDVAVLKGGFIHS